jgi:hypothetical protein
MNETSNDILLSVTGTVTINTDEYRNLVERSAYLNVLTAFARDPKTYLLSDVTCIVSDLLKDGATTDDCPEDGDTEGAGDNA